MPRLDPATLAAVLDAAPVRIAVMDRRRRHIYVNAEMCAFLGLRREEILGTTVADMLGRATARRIAPLGRRALAGETHRWQGWIEYVNHDDPAAPPRRRYVDRIYAPVLGPRGAITAYMVITSDLTEAMRRQEELERRGRQLEEILDAIPARICLIGRDFRYRFVNREFSAFAGRKPEAIIGRTTGELVGPEVKRRLDPLALRALAGETVKEEGWIDYRRNGRKYVSWVFAPKRADDGSIEGFAVFMRDLTELKAREEDLARRTAQLETILSSIGDGVSIMDPEGRLILCNKGFLDLFGFPAELGRPGTPIAAFVRDRLARGIRSAHDRRDADAGTLVAERVARILGATDSVEEDLRSDGVCLEIRRRRLPDGCIVSTYTDITARHEAERARRAQRDALRRAEQLSTTASLLAGVAHEINNPLAVVAAQALLLAEEAEGTPLAARAEAVREAAQRCGRIVASLMASARRRAQRREVFDLADAVRSGLDLAGYGLRAAGIALELDLPDGLPKLRGDPDQIAHVVANLVANAQHALEGLGAGGDGAAAAGRPRRLAISARRAGGTVELRVADSGPGIPPELRERIFGPFFTTKPDGVGTGVGLALCRAVAGTHGGAMRAEETPGGGATFVLSLPVPPGPPAAEGRRLQETAAER
ncbi:PAS domain-containing protein [Caldovatus aquaticus]|uniref:histidine kinase n=1 Tax=Caldovatus aquaticus TaxID=2865671 RepID=A0ABS7EZW9_9PROT|nr:PAS domain-containing protein [Caldovatus aquaticus]MBW8268252.1 PAS domain-containing protein [Caldovatus aquaticus]